MGKKKKSCKLKGVCTNINSLQKQRLIFTLLNVVSVL